MLNTLLEIIKIIVAGGLLIALIYPTKYIPTKINFVFSSYPFSYKTGTAILMLIIFSLFLGVSLLIRFLFSLFHAKAIFPIALIICVIISVILNEKINRMHEQFPYITEDKTISKIFYGKLFLLLTIVIGLPFLSPLTYFLIHNKIKTSEPSHLGVISIIISLTIINLFCLLIHHWHKKHPVLNTVDNPIHTRD